MDDDMIRLGQFLKYANLADTGGQARELITAGCVTVNGDVERRRGRQLHGGEQIEVRVGDNVAVETVSFDEPDVAW